MLQKTDEKFSFEVNPSLVGGVIFLCFSLFLMFVIPSQIKTKETSLITAQSYPFLIAGVMFFASAQLIVREAIKVVRKEETKTIRLSITKEARVFLLFLILIAYPLLMPLSGYLIASAILCLSMLLFYRDKNVFHYLIVLASCFLVNYLFKHLLNVQLP